MNLYKDLSGASGITHYELGKGFIDLKFKGGRIYRYDSNKPGKNHVDKMCELANSGEDLATYVNKNVRKNFSEEIK